MALSRTLIRTYITDHHDSPERLLQIANDRLRAELPGGTMITMIYGVLDPEAGTFQYSNAGHPPARLFHQDRQKDPDLLNPTGTPLGMFDHVSWLTEKLELPRGSLLLFYTDGIEDAHDALGKFFGSERVIKAVQMAGMTGGAGARERLLQEFTSFSGSTPRFDDVTLVLLARET